MTDRIAVRPGAQQQAQTKPPRKPNRRKLLKRRAGWSVAIVSACVFFILWAALTVQLAAGRDPVLGAKLSSQKAVTARARRPVEIRRIVRTIVIKRRPAAAGPVTPQGGGAPAATTAAAPPAQSAPAPAAPAPAPAPRPAAPAPAPAPAPTTRVS